MKLDTRILMSRCDGHRFVARLRKYDGRDQQLRYCGRHPALRRSCSPATQPRVPGTPRAPPRDPHPRHHLELNANHAGHSSRPSTRTCTQSSRGTEIRLTSSHATTPRAQCACFPGANASVSHARSHGRQCDGTECSHCEIRTSQLNLSEWWITDTC